MRHHFSNAAYERSENPTQALGLSSGPSKTFHTDYGKGGGSALNYLQWRHTTLSFQPDSPAGTGSIVLTGPGLLLSRVLSPTKEL
jgi:hypothetical protein